MQRWVLKATVDPAAALTRAAFAGLGRRHGLELRYPFLDHDLLEYALALQGDLRQLGTHPHQKALLREAMVGHLPDAVRLRTETRTLGHLNQRGWRLGRQLLKTIVRGTAVWDVTGLDPAEVGGLTYFRLTGRASPAVVRLLQAEAFLQYALPGR